MASSYFEQVQEAAARQKNVLRDNGRISVTDPALVFAAADGIDAPGLSPGDLDLNASAGPTSKSARKSPTKVAAGSSRRPPRNLAAPQSSNSTAAPVPPIPGSARSQRASPLNARVINSLELQALEASDAEVLGWLSSAASSRSVVESDKSSDSVAEALEERPASPLTPASVSPDPSTGQKRPSTLVTPISTKKARSSASTKPSGTPRPVAKSASRARPAAKYNKAAKSATKTARVTVKTGKSARSADPTTPASGQSASASGTAALSAPTASASSGQVSARGGGNLTPRCVVPPYHDAPDPRCPSSLKRHPRAGPYEDLA
ncbi:unnamed protein product [Phytophthora fragariaefolia]|uniref:Unnamed protein product n=1 Tax=Phytophthora fragariaefolia TaxID=1490495 RepID=A0A9W6XEH0_9STRA|nr:unnamed protein product [Phytophthora fragariaefolia]